MSEEGLNEEGPILTIGGKQLYLDSLTDDGKTQLVQLQQAEKALSTIKALHQAVSNFQGVLDLATLGFEAMTVQTAGWMVEEGAIEVAAPAEKEEEPVQETH